MNSLKTLLAAGAAATSLIGFGANALAQEASPKFTEAQKRGYLGETSKSAMARNVLARLETRHRERRAGNTMERILGWHEVLLDSIALDHTPHPDTAVVQFIQGGPTRSSRALAMTQIAVFDAVNAFSGEYHPYNDIGRALPNASVDAAIAYASHGVQVAMFPAQKARLDETLAADLAAIHAAAPLIERGREIGERAAAAILEGRADDNTLDPEPDWGEGGRVADGATTFFGTPVNGGTALLHEWEPDPLTPDFSGDFELALGAFWGGMEPFALERGDQFRAPPPPEPGSPEYIAGYNETKAIGASPDTPGSTSTPETRFIGNYWGYDATPLLGAPPRLYNQIAVQVALDHGVTGPGELARYLAMVNTALGDAGVSAWDSKYFYNYWRPVTAIRKSDGVAETDTDPDWKPVGISVINTTAPITPTPPFPAYPSGHATFAAAMFEIMRGFFGNETPFTFVSDEYNGEGDDPLGNPRPLVPVRFSTLQEAQEQNGVSRIYNGVHWQWDNLQGQAMGEKIGRHILEDFEPFQPCEGEEERRGRR